MRNASLVFTLLAIAACEPVNTTNAPAATTSTGTTTATATATATATKTNVTTTPQNETVTVTVIDTVTNTTTVTQYITLTAVSTATTTNTNTGTATQTPTSNNTSTVTSTATTVKSDAGASNDARPAVNADAGVVAKNDAAADALSGTPLTDIRVTCGDPTKLPAGVSLPFEAIGNAGASIGWCSFFLGNILVKTVTTAQTDGSYLAEVVLKAGSNTVVVRCADVQGNDVIGQITVNALVTDSGVTVGPDASPSSDAQAAADTVPPPDATPVILVDAGTDTQTIPDARPFVPPDALGSTDADTVCLGYAKGQTFVATEGQVVDCTNYGVLGKQKCVSGQMTACVVTADAMVSQEHAHLDCALTASNVGTIILTGNVVGDMLKKDANGEAHPISVGVNGTPINRLCLVGDGTINGWTGNRSHCMTYDPNASAVYTFTGLSFVNGDNRFTFLTYWATADAPDGEEYWDDNFVFANITSQAPTANQRCYFKDMTSKLVFNVP